MRLLNTQTWKLVEFICDDEIPPYVVLSHTWEEEEVTFQQWEAKESIDISETKGHAKITSFGQRAAADGFSWVWVDTYAQPKPPGYQDLCD